MTRSGDTEAEFSPDPVKPTPYPEPIDPPSAFREYMESRYER